MGLLKRQREEDSWKLLGLHCLRPNVYAETERIVTARETI